MNDFKVIKYMKSCINLIPFSNRNVVKVSKWEKVTCIKLDYVFDSTHNYNR